VDITLLYLGRMLFGGFFVFNGFNHFKMLEMMSGYAKSKGVPMPKVSVAFTGLLLMVGGLSVLLNVLPAIGLAALIVFLLPVTFIMHAFWKVDDAMAKMHEMVNFMKNMALLGAVLLMLARLIAD
jgi:putative oxidoreductase